jgi:hypothetical protein
VRSFVYEGAIFYVMSPTHSWSGCSPKNWRCSRFLATIASGTGSAEWVIHIPFQAMIRMHIEWITTVTMRVLLLRCLSEQQSIQHQRWSEFCQASFPINHAFLRYAKRPSGRIESHSLMSCFEDLNNPWQMSHCSRCRNPDNDRPSFVDVFALYGGCVHEPYHFYNLDMNMKKHP